MSEESNTRLRLYVRKHGLFVAEPDTYPPGALSAAQADGRKIALRGDHVELRRIKVTVETTVLEAFVPGVPNG